MAFPRTELAESYLQQLDAGLNSIAILRGKKKPNSCVMTLSPQSKPIIDILVVVPCCDGLDRKSSLMTDSGYEIKGELGISGRRYFQKNVNGERAFHIHAYEQGNEKVDQHILYRDRLQADFSLAKQYEDLKIKLADKFKYNKSAYTEGKSSFILNCIEQ